MMEQERLFCEKCNPQNVYQKDRRETDLESLASNVLSFSDAEERRRRKDRRRGFDRRSRDSVSDVSERRSPVKGRRPFDGYAWFEGCIEEAILAQWQVEEANVSTAAVSKPFLCPRCRQNRD